MAGNPVSECLNDYDGTAGERENKAIAASKITSKNTESPERWRSASMQLTINSLPTNFLKVLHMTTPIPSSTQRQLQFKNGIAIGTSQRWNGGQYCSVITAVGIVGCGIYDLKTPEEFGQAIAIAKGTPACPLTEPEDLFQAKIFGVTAKAAEFGIKIGDTGLEAIEIMLAQDTKANQS